MLRLLFILSACLMTFRTLAGNPPSDKELLARFDQLLSAAFPATEPGAAVVVARKGEILYHKAFGLANLELATPMTTDNVFEIGSVTKQFTGIAILMLLEEGRLSLDDDITKYLPDYPTHGHHISIHHLLTHTSGIKSYTSLQKWAKEWRRDFTPLEMIDFFKDEPMDFAPGEKFEYNNSAYFILGYVIEKASGMTYEDFIEQRIFQPLGMSNSRYGHKAEIVPNRANGYSFAGGFVNAPYISMTQPYAAGSLMSTVQDLLTWNKAVHSYSLVKKNTLEKAFTNYTTSSGESIGYGYGWSIDKINDSPTYEHSGGIFGYVSNGIYLPKEDLYVAILCNNDSRNVGEISTRIAALAIGKPYPADLPAITVPVEQLATYVGVFRFEDGTERTISLEGEQLYSQRTGSTGKFKIIPYAAGKFYYENSLSSIAFAREGEDITAVFTNQSKVTTGRKADAEIPAGRKELALTPDQLAPFLGTFEIQPGFNVTFTLKDGQLMTQATGQEMFPIYAETPTKFFLKVLEAQVEFIADDSGAYNSIMLYQGGASIPGRRIK